MKKRVYLFLADFYNSHVKEKIKNFLNYCCSLDFKAKTKTKWSVNFFHPTYILGHRYISVNGNIQALPGLRIECIDYYHGQTFKPILTIGKGVSFNYRCHISVINEVTIEDNVMFGSNVLVTDSSHGIIDKSIFEIPVSERELFSKGPVRICENVWLGENVCVMPGVTIGRNTIIGAGAVVTKSIPENCLAAGNPAKVIRNLGDNL
jgi:Acetyltransferase (isoleucine patch superfamily)